MRESCIVLVAVSILAAATQAAGAPPPREDGGEGPRAQPKRVVAGGRLVRALLEETNRVREAHGLLALAHSEALAAGAQPHAEDMLARGYFAHASPEGEEAPGRVRRLSPRAIVLGIRENIRKVKEDGNDAPETRARDAIEAWLDSPGHRENLLNDESTHVGFGAASTVLPGRRVEYIVQVFGVVAGWWEKAPQSVLSRPAGWRAKLLVPLEFFLDDKTRPQLRYSDPTRAFNYWTGGAPLVVSRAESESVVRFPRLRAGNYVLLARRKGEKGFQELLAVRVTE